MMHQEDKDKKKSKEEEINRSKIGEVNQIFDDIAENPEKLTIDLAMSIYNNFFFKRNQIISVYFKYLKKLDTWLEIYKFSKDTDETKGFALENIKKVTADNSQWIALFESEKDEELQRISVNKVSENSHNLDDWIEVYTLSSYGTEISKNALINMKKHAKSHEDWKKIYDLTPFDTKAKNYALEQLMVTAEPVKEKKEEEDKKVENNSNQSWEKEYNRIGDLYAQHKDLALLNKYIFANSAK